MSSERQKAANGRNGKLGDGPKNTSVTKYNATQHGLRAERLTPLDDREEYDRLLAQLEHEFRPADCFDQMLIEKAALYAVKVTTAEKLEHQFLKSALDPRDAYREKVGADVMDLFGKEKVRHPGTPAVVNHANFEKLLLYQRYNAGFMNLFLRVVHELERRQMRRRGERVSPPQVVDLSLPSISIQEGTSTPCPATSSTSESICAPRPTTDARSLTNALNTSDATSEHAHGNETELIRAGAAENPEDEARGNRMSLEAEGSKSKRPEASPPWQVAKPKPLWNV